MLKHIRPAISVLLGLTIVTGVIYPILNTAIAQSLFPYQANGSLVVRDEKTVGSEFIGQSFTNPKYFWGRTSKNLLEAGIDVWWTLNVQHIESLNDIVGQAIGLGLAICRTIATILGGSFTASNPEGGGAEFVLRLPMPKTVQSVPVEL